MFRLAAIFSHPIQYFAPLLRVLAAEPEVDLTVYYCSPRGTTAMQDPGFNRAVAWDIPLLQGYRYKFLPGLLGNPMDQWTYGPVNSGIVRELSRGGYDAVWVNGYMAVTNWLAMLTCEVKRIPVLLRGETNPCASGPARRRLPREIFLRTILPRVAGCLYIGTNNKAFYSRYGVPESRLFFTPYSVDNDFFRARALECGPQREAIRAAWGIHDNRPVILFAGKLISRKQPLLLLEAYRRLRSRHRCALLFAGDGPLRTAIEATVADQRIPDVHITGFLNQTVIPRAYTAADIFVLPSAAETWGLVVNEAMNFSLPVVVSDRVGCAPDLVRPGENGYVFSHHSADDLQQFLAELIVCPGRRVAFGRSSLDIIRLWNLSATAAGFGKIIQQLKRANH